MPCMVTSEAMAVWDMRAHSTWKLYNLWIHKTWCILFRLNFFCRRRRCSSFKWHSIPSSLIACALDFSHSTFMLVEFPHFLLSLLVPMNYSTHCGLCCACVCFAAVRIVVLVASFPHQVHDISKHFRANGFGSLILYWNIDGLLKEWAIPGSLCGSEKDKIVVSDKLKESKYSNLPITLDNISIKCLSIDQYDAGA